MEEKLPAFGGQTTQLVFKNRITCSGHFLRLEKGIIFLKDLTGKIHTFPVAETEEAVFDAESPY